jgi:hypothetical protein|uniref:Uncharacterized protein n=1 Tax=viral metagenome TaxID=1070528 RepID=A0A6C0BH08_9ZZZZ
MSGVYFITITEVTDIDEIVIFKGSFVVDYQFTPNIVAFFENGNPNNILAPTGSYGDNDNLFVSRSYPFTQNGTNITSMSYYAGNYGSNTLDFTYNFYSLFDDPANGTSATKIYNFDDVTYFFDITGGPAYPPFPLDGSIPPVCFYTIQGLPMYLNQNVQYKIYYTDYPQFPYLSVNADIIYPQTFGIYNVESIPLGPLLSNMNQSQMLTYQQQIQLFKKVYEYNSNAYITYVSNPGTANGPIYYTFQNYKEMTNYKAGLELINRLYPFNIMANAYNVLTGVPLNWIVPFPM